MNPPFHPSPGDRLRSSGMSDGVAVLVTAVGTDRFLGIMHSQDGTPHGEDSYFLSGNWLPALPPHVYPERFLLLTPDGRLQAGNFTTAEQALHTYDPRRDEDGDDPAIQLLHILPDGTTRWEPPPADPEPAELTDAEHAAVPIPEHLRARIDRIRAAEIAAPFRDVLDAEHAAEPEDSRPHSHECTFLPPHPHGRLCDVTCRTCHGRPESLSDERLRVAAREADAVREGTRRAEENPL